MPILFMITLQCNSIAKISSQILLLYLEKLESWLISADSCVVRTTDFQSRQIVELFTLHNLLFNQEFYSRYVIHTAWLVCDGGVTHYKTWGEKKLISRSPNHVSTFQQNTSDVGNAPATAPPSLLPWPESRECAGQLCYVKTLPHDKITCVHKYRLFRV